MSDLKDRAEAMSALIRAQNAARSPTAGVIENATYREPMRTVPVLFKPVLQPDGSMKLISADPNLPVLAGDVFIADVPVPDEFWPKRVTAIVRKVEDAI